uniref:DNA-directed DNA polymerase n=1 Tax=Candidatus Kentrum sp. LFY TaxID=2126342 RepID=A0A450UQ95_9GAMM|nr:MAG: DNA polymerase-3 subunit delta' [Candidatus Kentron sp. LFY]
MMSRKINKMATSPKSAPASTNRHTPVAPATSFPWHTRQWETCLHMQRTNRIHHAFLLRGARGNGKQTFATRWANALVCEETQPERRPCGLCRGCVLFGANTHPDIKMVEPPPGKKAIGIDQIREVIDYVWLSRQFAPWKIVSIPGAERMTPAAANTLLKTLEEPPGNAVFILVSHRSDRLPITIRSRCRFLDFPIPPRESVLPWLVERLPRGSDAALLLDAVGGAPQLALRYGEDGTLEKRVALHQELTMLLTGKANPFTVSARWRELGLAVVLPWIVAYLMDLIRSRFTGETRSVTGEAQPAIHAKDANHANAMRPLADKPNLAYCYRLLDRCLDAQRAREDSANLNEPLLLDGLAIDFAIHDS